MATNHHHHHQCHCLPTTTTTSCYCTTCYTTTHHPQPPPPIHSISSNHHHHAPPQTHHTQHYSYSYNCYPQTHQDHHFFQNPPPQSPQPINPTVSSLIHRIAALESSLLLRRRSSSSKHSPTTPSSSSLRDVAARTIQTHFRAYLVRRSATLRHLKHLAHIKSAVNRLKSSVSSKTHFDSRTLSRESMGLLIKLDSIQGSDPMIRDGKDSISRELIRFMELIEEMCTVKNVRLGKTSKKTVILQPEGLKIQRKCISQVGERFSVENTRRPGVGQIRIGDLTKSQGKSQPKVKKNVRFDEDGNVYRLFRSSDNQVSSDGSDATNGDDDEEVEVEVEEIGVSSKETEVEEDDSSEISENEMDPRKNLRTRIHHTTKKNQPDQNDDDDDDDDEEEEDSFVFSAPLPAKMEY